jgi:hypothetical protein
MFLQQFPQLFVGAELRLLDLANNLLLVLLFGHVLGWHFVRFGQVLGNRKKLARVLVFVSATTLLIISVVKVSLALSLGLVGALSIIRFRTPVKEPEELAYLFLAIALGVGLGADQRWETALVFTVILAVMALRGGLPGGRVPLLTVLQVSATGEATPTVDELLAAVTPHCGRVDLRRVDHEPGSFHCSLLVELRREGLQPLLDAIKAMLPEASVSVVERDGQE